MRHFMISFTLCFFLHGPHHAGAVTIQTSAPNPVPTPSAPVAKQKWQIGGMGELQVPDGTPLSFTAYKSADGVSVTVIHGKFSSEMRAAQELDRMAKKAEKVVDQGLNRDLLGNAVGKRVLLLVRDKPSDTLETAIVWTNAESFYEILSSSEPAALYWEKRYRRD